MTLQIKSLSGELVEDQKKYLRKKFLWFEKHLENSVILTVGVKQHITKKSNQAFEIVLHAIIPKIKKPLYVRVYKNNFNEAVDVTGGKLERMVLRKKNKSGLFRFKLPSIKVFKKGER